LQRERKVKKRKRVGVKRGKEAVGAVVELKKSSKEGRLGGLNTNKHSQQ